MNLNSLIPGIESFLEDVNISNTVNTSEGSGGSEEKETAAPAEAAPVEIPAETPVDESEEQKPAEMKSGYFDW